MSDEQTLTGYLGSEFQMKLLYELCTDTEFAEKTIPLIEIGYFDNSTYKKFFSILSQYFNKYERPANLHNRSISLAIKKFARKAKREEIDMLIGVGQQIKNWDDGIINRQFKHDGDIIQKETFNFIKQQEWRKIGDFIDKSIKEGNNGDDFLYQIEEKTNKVGQIGMSEDMGIELMENTQRALRPNFRKTIPTGIKGIDAVTNGGLGKGEIGLILAPSGVGKSTILSYIANTAYHIGYNVLQLIFEDKPDDIRRKHFAKMTKIPLSEMDDRLEETDQKLKEWHKKNDHGRLIIKKCEQEGTTIPKIKQWIESYQKKMGVKFDIIILDYLDEVETHKKSTDNNTSELQIIKAFEAMADEYDIPCWSAIQGNRGSFNVESVGHQHMGGNIKRAQKTHFLMSIAKTPDQKESDTANMQILKARFAKDGYLFRDCIFNNDTMEIAITDELPPFLLKRLKDKTSESTLKKISEMTNARYENEETDNYDIDDDVVFKSDNNNDSDNDTVRNYENPASDKDEYDGIFDISDIDETNDVSEEESAKLVRKKNYDEPDPYDIDDIEFVKDDDKGKISDVNDINELLKQKRNEYFNDS